MTPEQRLEPPAEHLVVAAQDLAAALAGAGTRIEPEEGQVLFSVGQAAVRCGISERTLRAWIANGDVETVDINGRLRVPVRWFRQFQEPVS